MKQSRDTGQNLDRETVAARRAPNRRTFLKVTAATAAGVAVGCGSDAPSESDAAGQIDAELPPDAAPPDATPPDATPPEPPEPTPVSTNFGLGISSGDVTTERAVLWARYDGAMLLQLVVWEMADETYARTIWDEPATPADGGFVHVDVDGLAAGATFRYAFFEMDAENRAARSEVGRFRAAIAEDDLNVLRFGATSCAKNGRDFAVLEHAGARTDMDAFLLVGDTVYADPADGVAEFRSGWADNLSTPGYRALRANTSVLATWDDHEVENNWNGEEVDPTLLADALQVFFENTPMRRNAEDAGRIWRSVRWGKTAELFILDERTERKPSTRSGPNAEYISIAQMDWLKAGLAASMSTFKLIINSVPIGDFPLLFDAASADRWEGYAAQREEILSFIDDTPITGVVWISGDFHMASLGRVGADSDDIGGTQLEALVGPAAQIGNPLALGLGGSQFDWATAADSYTTLLLEPALRRVTFQYFGADGDAIHEQSYILP